VGLWGNAKPLPWERMSAGWRTGEGEPPPPNSFPAAGLLPHPVGSADHLLPREKEGATLKARRALSSDGLQPIAEERSCPS
jgi:hypothetical protein